MGDENGRDGLSWGERMDATQHVGMRSDGYVNCITGSGTERDKRSYSRAAAPDEFVAQTLHNLFATNALAQRICVLPAREMTRKEIEFTVEAEDKEQSKSIATDVMQWLHAKHVFFDVARAIALARLYGGCVIYMKIDDGLSPDLPVNEARIRDIKFFNVLDRTHIRPLTFFGDPLAENYGQPQSYQLTASPIAGSAEQAHNGAIIHASRLLRFDGTMTPPARMQQQRGWSDSIFVAMAEPLRALLSAWSTTDILLQDFAQAIYAIKGVVGGTAAESEERVKKRLAMIDLYRSTIRAMVLDAEFESFERKMTPMTGLPEAITQLMYAVAAQAEIPMTLLFGMSPGGLSATGESDVRFFYDTISARQKSELRPQFEKLIRYLLLARNGPTRGIEPKKWDFTFCPLWQMSDLERATQRKTVAETDEIYINSGVVTPDEVANSRFGGDTYSTETHIDMEARAMTDSVSDSGAVAEIQAAEAAPDSAQVTADASEMVAPSTGAPEANTAVVEAPAEVVDAGTASAAS